MLPLPGDAVKTVGSSLALIGGSEMLKTSLLLQAAMTLMPKSEQTGSDDDPCILFLRPDRMPRKPPSVHHMSGFSSDVAHEKIIPFDIKDTMKVIDLLANFRAKKTKLRAIIIDDLHIFARRRTIAGQDQDPETLACKLLLLAQQMAASCTPENGFCYLLIGSAASVKLHPDRKTCQPVDNNVAVDDTVSLLPTIKLFIENIVRLEKSVESGSGDKKNYYMDYNDFHITLYEEKNVIFLDQIEQKRLKVIAKNETSSESEKDSKTES